MVAIILYSQQKKGPIAPCADLCYPTLFFQVPNPLYLRIDSLILSERKMESKQVSENSYYKCPVCNFKSLQIEKRQGHVQKHTLKEIYESGWTEFYPLMTGLPEGIKVLRDWSLKE